VAIIDDDDIVDDVNFCFNRICICVYVFCNSVICCLRCCCCCCAVVPFVESDLTEAEEEATESRGAVANVVVGVVVIVANFR